MHESHSGPGKEWSICQSGTCCAGKYYDGKAVHCHCVALNLNPFVSESEVECTFGVCYDFELPAGRPF